MRGLPTALAIELAKDVAFFAHLVQLDLSTPVYYTDLDLDVVWGGNVYLSRGLRFDNIDLSIAASIDRVSFEIDNVGLEISALVLNNETRGRGCTIYLAALDAYGQVLGADIVFNGMLDGVRVDAKKGSFDVYSHLILWKKRIPGRIHQATCPWIFKDAATCRYAGVETWCDHSYDRCAVLNNNNNFGGFRFLPSLQNKQLWWGRAQG